MTGYSPAFGPHHAFLSSPDQIIDDARNGRMYILVDDEDRENEGDLIVPAQMATPEKINFMARHGRGLICLALTKARANELGLDLMNRDNATRFETAFTVSIEARDGVTTGISAADRARTVAAAIDSAVGREAIVTPGHVFPLIARDGGVLVRAGHTEAAVDVSRLAGLNPSGVICEIMKDDGSMARLDDLVGFAALHGLRIGTIRDLIAYRRRNDHLVEKRAELPFDSRYGGRWTAMTFYNRATREENVALVKGFVDSASPTLVRMHTMSGLIDMFGEISERSSLLPGAMLAIAAAGSGVIVIINRATPDMISKFMQARAQGQDWGMPGIEQLRDYGVGAQILTELGVQDMILLSNTRHTLVGLEGYGLSIVGQQEIPSSPDG